MKYYHGVDLAQLLLHFFTIALVRRNIRAGFFIYEKIFNSLIEWGNPAGRVQSQDAFVAGADFWE